MFQFNRFLFSQVFIKFVFASTILKSLLVCCKAFSIQVKSGSPWNLKCESSFLGNKIIHWNLDVNFTNIFKAAFSYRSSTSSFSVPKCRFNIFVRKEISVKAAHKRLVKLTIGRLQRSSVFGVATNHMALAWPKTYEKMR